MQMLTTSGFKDSRVTLFWFLQF